MDWQYRKDSAFPQRPAGPAWNRGLTLVEVLVALLVLSLGLLGLAALQASALRQVRAVWLHERAQQVLHELAAAARAEPDLADSLPQLTPEPPAAGCQTPWDTLPASAYWAARLACDLPDAVLSVQRVSGQTRLQVHWASAGTASGAVSQAQVTVSGLP